MPPESPVRILFVGDLHLGRRTRRVPAAVWKVHGLDPELATPVAAWRRTVAEALARNVTAVALAGDLVDQEDDLFEARGHLEDGFRRLAAAGIRICAVAGNHDTRVMPVLAEVIPELELLGPGGTWSTATVAPGVRLAGWSFPANHHAASPLLTPPPAQENGTVTIGLLHTELDRPDSVYAPTTTAELATADYEGWALGHIHRPDAVPAPGVRRPFYLGSLCGTTPNETGLHGPVLATVDAGRIGWERLPLAPFRWEHRIIPVDGLAPDGPLSTTDLRNHLLRHVTGLALNSSPALLGLRLTLSGDHRRAEELAVLVEDFDPSDLVTKEPDGPVLFIDRLETTVTVPVDLAELARRSDPPGLLARRILALEDGDPGCQNLLDAARRATSRLPVGPGVTPDESTDADLRAELAAVGRRALSALLTQSGEETP